MVSSPNSSTSRCGSESACTRRRSARTRATSSARTERLDQVVVGAQFEADDAVLHLAFGGQHDDGHVGIVADGAADALAWHAGKHEVEHHQVEVVLVEFFESLLAVSDGRDPVIFTFEVGRHSIADGFLVFDEQNAASFIAHNWQSSQFSGGLNPRAGGTARAGPVWVYCNDSQHAPCSLR